WSYDLLDEQEQLLFRRLSVFTSGCTLAAIEAIYVDLGDETAQLLDMFASLIDKSLLQQAGQEDGEPRLLLLETIREYGLECLSASEEAEAVHKACAMYFLSLAEQAQKQYNGPEQALWIERLEPEHPNMREALLWLIAQAEAKKTGYS